MPAGGVLELTALEGAALAAAALCLLLVPLGLPGLWGMVAVLLGLCVAGAFPWLLWVALTLLAGTAEVGEFLVVKRFGRRYGGSSRAVWGAIAGGFAGLFVGLPVPVLGSLAMGLAGTFAGAAAVTLVESRSARAASRVGWGVLLARVASAAIKVGAGVILLLVAAVRLLGG